MENISAFFEACESHNITDARNLLVQLDLSGLIKERTREGRTCFHVAVISGDTELLRELAAKLQVSGLINIIKRTDENGETVLHLAVRKDRVDLMRLLVDLDASLCDCANKGGETPLELAVFLGLKEAVEFLITRTSNALHYIVEFNQVRLVEYLIELSKKNKLDSSSKENKLNLSELINKPYQPDNGGNPATHIDTQDDQPIFRRGDTPLHIAARNKNEHMVSLLLKVRGVNKFARNSEDKTPFEIAKEVTEYYESFRIIRKLEYYSVRPKPFLYCAPQMSYKKLMEARRVVRKSYEDRRNAEQVVAALLATMTFTAVFSMPGGFQTENTQMDEIGSPVLIPFTLFKLFLFSDCIAFFLALFVCIMWQMIPVHSPGDKMLFMTGNSLLISCSFGFTALGFMAAMYAVLARKVKTFSWVVLGSLIAINLCGLLAVIGKLAEFALARARFNRLCAVPSFLDDIVEQVWSRAERCGLLNLFRSGERDVLDCITGRDKFGSPTCSPSRSYSFNYV